MGKVSSSHEADGDSSNICALSFRNVRASFIDSAPSLVCCVHCYRITTERYPHLSNQDPGGLSWREGTRRQEVSGSPPDFKWRSRWEGLVTVADLRCGSGVEIAGTFESLP